LFSALFYRATISAVCCLVVLPILLSVYVLFYLSVSWLINDEDDDMTAWVHIQQTQNRFKICNDSPVNGKNKEKVTKF